MTDGAALNPACVFCHIANEGNRHEAYWDDAVAIVPLDPVTPGHVIVMPKIHVRDALEDPMVTAATMKRAVEYARGQQLGPADEGIGVNLITSCGTEATQSIFHLHIHVVPRRAGDGLQLPWTGQIRRHA